MRQFPINMPALLEFVYTFKLILRFCEKLWTSGAVVEILKLIVLLQFFQSFVPMYSNSKLGGGALFLNKCSFYKMVLYLCFWNDIFFRDSETTSCQEDLFWHLMCNRRCGSIRMMHASKTELFFVCLCEYDCVCNV